MSATDLVRRLQELAELRASGVVDDGEYALAKAMLLGAPPSPAAPPSPSPAAPPPRAAPPSPATVGDRMARRIEVAGYGMLLGLPVLIAVFVGLVLLAAVVGSAISG